MYTVAYLEDVEKVEGKVTALEADIERMAERTRRLFQLCIIIADRVGMNNEATKIYDDLIKKLGE